MDGYGGQEAGSGAPGVEALPLLGESDGAVQVVKRGGRARLLVAAVAAVGIVAGVVAVVAGSGGDGDGTEALRAAQQVVADNPTYRYEQLSKVHVSTGDPDGAGSDTTTRELMTGVVGGADRWHVTADVGDDLGFGDELDVELEPFETIRIGSTVYSAGFSMMPLGEHSGPKWVASELPDDQPTKEELASLLEDFGFGDDDPYADEMRLQLALQGYLSDPSGDPSAISRVVTEARDPQVEEARGDGGVLLRVQLPPDPAFAKVAELPAVDMTLLLDGDRRPVEARFTASTGSASADVIVTFSDWGGAIAVDPPADEDIDRTPWVQEEALAALDPRLLLAPTVVPDPLEIVGATVMDQSMYMDVIGPGEGEPEECPMLSLTFGSEADAELATSELDPDLSDEEMEALWEDMQYLDVTIAERGCGEMEYADEDYFDDELAGHPAMGEDGYWEVDVDGRLVTVSSTLDDDAVAALVTSLAPTTADALVAGIPTWAADIAGAQLGAMGATGMGMFPMWWG